MQSEISMDLQQLAIGYSDFCIPGPIIWVEQLQYKRVVTLIPQISMHGWNFFQVNELNQAARSRSKGFAF